MFRIVERDGFAFPVEVVYERMPDFCKHCQNIGHVVQDCRWLYPREEKDSNAEKEVVVQGKNQVPTKRLEWVPLKDNPAGIGSSVAFQAPASIPQQINVESPTPLSQHQQPRDVSQQHQQPRDVEHTEGVTQQQQRLQTKEVPGHDFDSTEAFLALEHAVEAEVQVRNDAGNIISVPPDSYGNFG